MSGTRELIFLGTGASCGVPTFYCGCDACEEARRHPEYARSCSSIAIAGRETTLIDTSPELRLQFVRERLDGTDRVLYTHEHFDHVGGLPQLEYYKRIAARGVLPVYAGDECATYVEHHFDFMLDVLDINRIKPFEPLVFDEVEYLPLPAAHCPGAFGYLISFGTMKVAYFPDTGPLSDEVLSLLAGIDILIMDSTFNGCNWMPEVHTTIDGAINAARMLHPKVLYLTHLSMHFDEPITATQLQERLDGVRKTEGLDVRMPVDGTRIVLS